MGQCLCDPDAVGVATFIYYLTLIPLILLSIPIYISGTVRDSISHDPLPYVNVYTVTHKIGRSTDINGFFTLNLDTLPERIVFSFLGYKSETLSISKKSDIIPLVIYLSPQPIETKPILVEARKTRFHQQVGIGEVTLPLKIIKKTPQLVEYDLLRSIQSLPGVTFQVDFTTKFSVQGGSPQENKVLLDGIPLYNPYHLGSFFSVFDMDALRYFRFERAGFGAEYGNALSSVLEAYQKTGRTDRIHVSTSLGLLTSKTFLEIPISHTTSLILGGRRSYFDLLIPRLTEFQFPYYFYDFYCKLETPILRHARIKVAGFLNRDLFQLKDPLELFINWGNSGASIQLEYLKTNRRLNLTAALNEFRTSLNLGGGLIHINSPMRTGVIKTTLDFQLSEWKNTSGFTLEPINFAYRSRVQGMEFHLKNTTLVFGLFNIAKRRYRTWLLELGARLDGSFLKYNGKTYFTVYPDPRLRIKYFVSEQIGIKGAIGRYHQFLSAVVGREREELASFSYWVPLFGKFKPMESYHFVLGTEGITSFGDWSVEAYLKEITRTYKENPDVDPSNLEETLLKSGYGRAVGVDLYLRKDVGRIQGMANFNIGQTIAWFEDEPAQYLPWDRTLSTNINISFPFLWNTTLTTRWTYGTGTPYTGTVGILRFMHIGYSRKTEFSRYLYLFSYPYGLRLPPYHRLDLSIMKGFNIGKAKGTLRFEIVNLYNHRNIFLYYWDTSYNPPRLRNIGMLPILPSIAVSIKW